MAIFRNSILTLKCYVCKIFVAGNRIRLQAAILDYSEVAVHSHPFLNISPKNSGVESFFWSNYRLTVQSSDYILK